MRRDNMRKIRKWHKVAQRVARVVRGGTAYLFAVGKNEGRWLALVVSTPIDSHGSIEGILDHHAHDVIGKDFLTMKAAQDACNVYLRKATKAKRCGCGPIIKPARPLNRAQMEKFLDRLGSSSPRSKT